MSRMLSALLLGAALIGAAPAQAASVAVPAAAAAQSTPSSTPDTRWWRALNDPVLDRLLERALQRNRDLLAAEAEVRRARALADVQRWSLLPVGGIGASAGRERAGMPPVEGDFASLGAAASWEIDLFGRIRAGAAAAGALALGAEEARRGTLVSIAAETASAYANLRGAQARLAAARANADSQRDTLSLTEKLRDAGRATRLDVARGREQLETTRATVAGLEAEVAAAREALKVLAAGLTPELEAALAAPGAVPRPPQRFTAATPDELLRRRPDIRLAETRVAAAGHRIKAARVDWWPRLTLTGALGWAGAGFGDLGGSDGFGFSLGPRIDWPALDFRRNQLRLEAAKAGAEVEFRRYEQAVLEGGRELETALVDLAAARAAAASLTEAGAAAREAAELSRLRYREGVDPFFSVLDAERRLAEAEDRLAVARTREALAYVRLGRALGAGWAS